MKKTDKNKVGEKRQRKIKKEKREINIFLQIKKLLSNMNYS